VTLQKCCVCELLKKEERVRNNKEMAKNTLNAAKSAKNDEFYTQLSDIENELRHYKPHFRGKTVFCNCDDPRRSNFFKYFVLNFEHLGLKRLITTCYKSQNADLFSKHDSEKAVYLIYDGDKNGNGVPDAEEIGIHPLKGDGDFRSPECVELLKQADIIVTNPPFSLFRAFVAQLMKYEKKFLIIGNQNAITMKEIFPLIKNNKIWMGYKCGDMAFKVPPDTKPRKTRYWQDENGQKWRSMGNACWYTNLDHNKRHEPLILYRRFSAEKYQMYDNYNAIDVGKVTDIPEDYFEPMGLPITFLEKYCPEQFEILGLTQFGCHEDLPDTKKYNAYKEYSTETDIATGSSGAKTNENAVLEGKGNKKTYYKNSEGRIVHSEYKRILIRRIDTTK